MFTIILSLNFLFALLTVLLHLSRRYKRSLETMYFLKPLIEHNHLEFSIIAKRRKLIGRYLTSITYSGNKCKKPIEAL